MNTKNIVAISGTIDSQPYVIKKDKKYYCFFDIIGKTFQYADKEEIIDINERFTVINEGRPSSYFYKNHFYPGMKLWVYGNLRSVEHVNEDEELVLVNYLTLRNIWCNEWD